MEYIAPPQALFIIHGVVCIQITKFCKAHLQVHLEVYTTQIKITDIVFSGVLLHFLGKLHHPPDTCHFYLP